MMEISVYQFISCKILA